MSAPPIYADVARTLTQGGTMTTLADAIATDLHQAVEAHRNQLHKDVEAIIGHWLTVPNLARELADTLAAAPPPPPAESAPAEPAGP